MIKRSMTIDQSWIRGMGTELVTLSVLLDLNINEIYVSHKSLFHSFLLYKQIFNIDDDSLTVFLKENTTGFSPNDYFKIHSPYYSISRPEKLRPYIGVVSYTNSTQLFNKSKTSTEFPYNKTYPIEDNIKIFEFIKTLGYDIITIDSIDIDKITKSHLIKDLCECVIGYEGGAAHLCHMLEVPFFMLPWRIKDDPIPREQLLHLDKRTYFLENLDELLSWNKQKFQTVLTDLNDQRGNNYFLSRYKNISFKAPMFQVESRSKLFDLEFSQDEKSFILENYTNFYLGGNK